MVLQAKPIHFGTVRLACLDGEPVSPLSFTPSCDKTCNPTMQVTGSLSQLKLGVLNRRPFFVIQENVEIFFQRANTIFFRL